MSDRRAEIDLELQWLDARDAFVAAKAKRGTPDWNEEEYRAAKARVSQMRLEWRGIGEYLGLRAPAGAIHVVNDAPTDTPQEG